MRIPAARLVTIHKGHDPDWYRFERPHRQDFDIPPDAFIVGFTGNIRPVKGIDVLLSAARILARDCPSVHFLLVGEVRDKAILRLSRDTEATRRIRFTGFRSDAAAIAGMCDAYVMPSVEREGLPRGVIEAMAQGVPPIVTDVGGMPELVRHEASGLIVPPRDPQALAAAIQRLAGAPELVRALGAEAKRRIATDFHIDRTVEKFCDLYAGLAPGSGVPPTADPSPQNR
jgi:glycosyltransferase involved in cell wall biosynthesis